MRLRRPPGKWLTRALVRPPYGDPQGRKGWLEPFTAAQPHVVHKVAVTIPGWPATPLRIAFLSDFHAGAHANDVARFRAIVDEAATFEPDLVLYGGDFVNMQIFGGGRVPPRSVAATLARLHAPLGRIAVLGNHDFVYGPDEVEDALEAHDIAVLDDESQTLDHAGQAIDIVGLPDARRERPAGKALLASLPRPTIVLAHDPAWFAHVPAGPHLTLSGHTHGGQFRLPFIGPIVNASHAPLRWSLGHIVEGGRQLYVSGGLGTSGLPLRIGVPPDYAIIDVRGGP